MKRIIIFAIVGIISVIDPSLQAQMPTWDEFALGDLPSSLGLMSLGTNRVIGAVGYGDTIATGYYIDSDFVQFMVPNGLRLDRFTVKTTSGNAVSFGLYRGTVVGANLVEEGMFSSLSAPVDLLRFDSAPGSQPAGTYIFSVTPALNDITLRIYTLDAVLTVVPEPSSGWLMGVSFLIMLCRRVRAGGTDGRNHRPALDAARASCLHSGGHWHRTSEAGRYCQEI